MAHAAPDVEAALAVDLVAERIRALGLPVPGTYRRFAELSTIEEEPGVPEWKDMVNQLVRGHEARVKQLPEKTAWMLRSLLE